MKCGETVNINMPMPVKQMIAKIQSKGFDAYAVGGCIRDSMMGKKPSDWDICTSAAPEEVLAILGQKNIVENGMKHGTVTVRLEHQNYEITTFRTDGEYLDNRHPKNVTFVKNLKEDLSRRDFTINAMAYNDEQGLCDEFDGIKDIQNRLIRCVGDPDQRFNEDALRILRALRFSSKLGFDIEKNTADSIHQNAGLLVKISAERILSEFVKILTGENVEKILTEYADVFCVLIPEIKPMIGLQQNNPHHIYDVWTHTIKAVAAVKPEILLRTAALFHDFGKPKKHKVDQNGIGHFKGHPEESAKMTEEIMTRMRFDNKTKKDVIILVKWHDVRVPAEPKYVRREIARTGPKLYPELLELKRADALAQNPSTIPDKLAYISQLQKIYDDEIANNGVFSVKELAVNGYDVKNCNIKDGKKIGECLEMLCGLVMDGAIKNDRAVLLEKIKEFAAQ